MIEMEFKDVFVDFVGIILTFSILSMSIWVFIEADVMQNVTLETVGIGIIGIFYFVSLLILELYFILRVMKKIDF